MNWINIKDELSSKNQKVLLLCENGVNSGIALNTE